MPDISFGCPHCAKSLIIDTAAAGRPVTCPSCTREIFVPSRSPDSAHRLDVDFGTAYSLEKGGELGIEKAIGQFRSLDYDYLVPIRKIFTMDLLRRRAVRWILLFGTLPLIFSWTARQFQFNFGEILWLLLTYFCLFWALYFYSLVQPTRDNWIRGIGYAVFTATAGLFLLFGIQDLPLIRSFYSTDPDSLPLLGRLLGFVLIVGVLEEGCKALPLLIFGLRGGRIRGVRDGVFLGLMSGFGFAALQAVRSPESARCTPDGAQASVTR